MRDCLEGDLFMPLRNYLGCWWGSPMVSEWHLSLGRGSRTVYDWRIKLSISTYAFILLFSDVGCDVTSCFKLLLLWLLQWLSLEIGGQTTLFFVKLLLVSTFYPSDWDTWWRYHQVFKTPHIILSSCSQGSPSLCPSFPNISGNPPKSAWVGA